MPPHVHLAVWVQSDLREGVEQELNVVADDGSRIVAFGEELSKFSTDYKEPRFIGDLDDASLVHESSRGKILALIGVAHPQLRNAFFLLYPLNTIHQIGKRAALIDATDDKRVRMFAGIFW